jgi:hypothetical protein
MTPPRPVAPYRAPPVERMIKPTLTHTATTAKRRRLLRNRATVAILAGHLAYEDLGDAVSGRASYGVAMDSA